MKLKVLFNTALGLVLTILWWQLVDIDQLINVLKNADYRFVIVFISFYIISTLLRSYRLKVLLNSPKITFSELTLLNMLSQFLSFIIPIRAGEITKGVYLSSKESLSISQSLIWVLLDRFFDFWMVLLVVTMAGLMINQQLVASAAALALLSFTLGAVIAILSQPLARKMANLTGPLKSFCLSIIEGFNLLKMPPQRWLMTLSLSFLALASDAVIWWSVLWAVGIDLNAAQALFSTGLSALTFLIPAAPGFVGSAEASGLVVLSYVMGLEANLASSGVVLNHLMTLIILPIFGLIGLTQLKFDLSSVWKKLRT